MDPCMLDDGLDPPTPPYGHKPHYHRPNWVPWEQEQEQSPSLFSGQDTESSVCRFIMGSHRRSSQCVKNGCETDEAGIFFILFSLVTPTALRLIWHCRLIIFWWIYWIENVHFVQQKAYVRFRHDSYRVEYSEGVLLHIFTCRIKKRIED